MLGVPLDGTGRSYGALVVARRRGDLSFSDADTALVTDFAGRASLALRLADSRPDPTTKPRTARIGTSGPSQQTYEL